MNIIVVGLSHKTAPVEVRELLAIPATRMGEALTRLCAYDGIREGIVLSTCNRVEVYAVVDDAEAGFLRIQEFLADTHLSLSSEQLMPHLYWQADDRAIHHLFRVAASLDSMIVGESQILGQLKDAFELSLYHKTTGVVLNKVVKKAISVAKRVRTETKIAEMAVSVSYAAVELARKIFSHLSERTVLLVGAGEMAKLAAQHFISSGVKQVKITTRDPAHARDLAQRFQGYAVPFDDFRHEMVGADVVLCSTGASHYLIHPEDVQRAVRQRMNRPIFLIDISVPRNIDPDVKYIDNAFLFDIDDLENRVEQNREERRREAVRAEHLVEHEVEVIRQWLKALEVTPTIVAVKDRAERIKRLEVDKALGRLGGLSDDQRAAVESMASGIINKMLHGALTTLKAEADSHIGSLFIEAARRFYSVEESSDTSAATQDGASAEPETQKDPSPQEGQRVPKRD